MSSSRHRRSSWSTPQRLGSGPENWCKRRWHRPTRSPPGSPSPYRCDGERLDDPSPGRSRTSDDRTAAPHHRRAISAPYECPGRLRTRPHPSQERSSWWWEGLSGAAAAGRAAAGRLSAGRLSAGPTATTAPTATWRQAARSSAVGAVLRLIGVFVTFGDVVSVPESVLVLGLVLVLELGLELELGAAPPVASGSKPGLGRGRLSVGEDCEPSFATPCPVASPFLESLTKRYSAWSWKNNCNRPPCTRTTVSPLTPRGAFTWATPFGNSKGGHALAHAPVHVAWPAGSTA